MRGWLIDYANKLYEKLQLAKYKTQKCLLYTYLAQLCTSSIYY